MDVAKTVHGGFSFGLVQVWLINGRAIAPEIDTAVFGRGYKLVAAQEIVL